MEQKTEENTQGQTSKDFATAAKDAVLCGAQALKRKMSGKKWKLDCSGPGQVAGLLRIMGSIIIIILKIAVEVNGASARQLKLAG